MNYSTTYIAVLVNILAIVLPYIGVSADTTQLTQAVQLLVAIATGIYIMYQRTTLQKAPSGVGDVTALGVKTN